MDRAKTIIQFLRYRYKYSDSPWIIIQLIPGDFEVLMDLSKTDQSSFAFFQKFRYAFITELPSSANLEMRFGIVTITSQQT